MGFWEVIHTALREALRSAIGRNVQPSAAIIDRQSVQTTGVGGERGYDGGTKIQEHTRHLVVDTQGRILAVKVHPANIADRVGVSLVLTGVPERLPGIRKL